MLNQVDLYDGANALPLIELPTMYIVLSEHSAIIEWFDAFKSFRAGHGIVAIFVADYLNSVAGEVVGDTNGVIPHS